MEMISPEPTSAGPEDTTSKLHEQLSVDLHVTHNS